ncbi:MAG: glycosyltransferase [Firmicutes bacterium]|nr:glycosyltransferase [Bacillota bacterium]
MIIALAIMSNRPEPFLGAMLESIADAVDLLVLNDNSSDPGNSNLGVVRESKLYKNGKVHLIFSEFEGFAPARNLCLDYIKKSVKNDSWVIMQDCDEVHAPSFTALTRKILPNLPERYGVVDGYFYQFVQTFDYFTSLDRRHNLIFRFYPDVRWEGDVHEKLVNLKGERLATPYIYFHYGYCFPLKDILGKLRHYGTLGDEENKSAQNMSHERLLDGNAMHCIQFKKSHPPSMKPVIEGINEKFKEELSRFDAIIKRQTFMMRLRNSFRNLNFKLRIFWRTLQLKWILMKNHKR